MSQSGDKTIFSAATMNRGFNISHPRNHYHRLKFDSDYDLQKANEQFQHALNKAMVDMEKLNIQREADTPTKPKLVDEFTINESSDSKTLEDNKSVKKLSAIAVSLFYDKNKSFFDYISCETREKLEGTNVRPDWRKERMINQETFGPVAVRSQQALYRSNMATRPGYQRLNPPLANNRINAAAVNHSNSPIFGRNGAPLPLSSMTYYRSNFAGRPGYNNNHRESMLNRYSTPAMGHINSPIFGRNNSPTYNRKLNMPTYGRQNAFNNRNDNSSVFRNVNSPIFSRNVKCCLKEKRQYPSRMDSERMKLYRQRYLDKRTATETPEEQAERMQKARENWARRWSEMSEEQRERHRSRNRERHRKNSAARQAAKKDSSESPPENLLSSIETKLTQDLNFGRKINSKFNAEDLFKQESCFPQLSASENLSGKGCLSVDDAHHLADSHLNFTDLTFPNTDKEALCEFSSHLESMTSHLNNTIGFLPLTNEEVTSTSRFISKMPTNDANIDSLIHLLAKKDESTPLGEMVVNVHRKMRREGFDLEAAKFKKNVMDLIADCEFMILERNA